VIQIPRPFGGVVLGQPCRQPARDHLRCESLHRVIVTEMGFQVPMGGPEEFGAGDSSIGGEIGGQVLPPGNPDNGGFEGIKVGEVLGEAISDVEG
jgi:hypothetical protein